MNVATYLGGFCLLMLIVFTGVWATALDDVGAGTAVSFFAGAGLILLLVRAGLFEEVKEFP